MVKVHHGADQHAHAGEHTQPHGIAQAADGQRTDRLQNPVIRHQRRQQRGHQAGTKPAEQGGHHHGRIEGNEGGQAGADPGGQGFAQQQSDGDGAHGEGIAYQWPLPDAHGGSFSKSSG